MLLATARKATVWGFAAATALGATALMAAPELRPSQQFRADIWQFVVTSDGPVCRDCCWTGYCCDVPIVCAP